MKRRLLEVVGQKTETRDVRRPSPARRRKGADRDLDGVARLGAVDEDGAGDRIDLCEVEPGDVGDRRLRVELAAGGIERMEFHRLARRDANRGRVGVVPAEMALMVVNRMLGVHRDVRSEERDPQTQIPPRNRYWTSLAKM